MSTIVDKQIAQIERAIANFVMSGMDDALLERVQLWIAKMTNGSKLSDFLHDESMPVGDRVKVGQCLVGILEAKDYARLPEVEKPKRKREPASDDAKARFSAKEEEPRGSELNGAFDGNTMLDVTHDGDRPGHHPPAEVDPMPPSDELRALVQQEVRVQLASILETIAKVLRDTK